MIRPRGPVEGTFAKLTPSSRASARTAGPACTLELTEGTLASSTTGGLGVGAGVDAGAAAGC